MGGELLSWVGGARAKDPGDPLLHSERTQGFTADPGYWKGEVFVYVGRNQNLKDLKDLDPPRRDSYLPFGCEWEEGREGEGGGGTASDS